MTDRPHLNPLVAFAMSFIHEDFLLSTPTARRLYDRYAAPNPILDYHCHLPPRDIAENRQFRNLFEIWLEGDHYKWRAMRANGVAERFITGTADPYSKFRAWAATVPNTLRNPLFHWTHLELKRYFDIDQMLDESSAATIWRQANERLEDAELTSQGILKKFHVRTLCTTDDPVDDLKWHRSLAARGCFARVLPAFRPDKALIVDAPEKFNPWVDALEQAAGVEIASFQDFLEALKARHDFFHAQGCRLSDHGLNRCPAKDCTARTAAAIFARARRGVAASPEEWEAFGSFLMLFFGRLDAAKDWTNQLHLGALRATNTRQLRSIGPDTGFDSIGDEPQAVSLAWFLDRLDSENALPRTIVYNVNPADNYVFASMIGNFQDEREPGKIQYGSGWWFLDQKDGIEWQLQAMSNLGLLSRFIGMITDSRSFMSYPRHEYFRRVLCNLFGRDVENGELPDDDELLGTMIRNICYDNAARYFRFPVVSTPESPAKPAATRARRVK
jgi:glucuronate isomerase